MNPLRIGRPILLMLLCLPGYLFSQSTVPVFGEQSWINGYSRSISGEVIPYFSVYPKYAKDALLVRCTDGKKLAEWETDVVPVTMTDKYAYFTWIAGHSSGTSGGDRYFDLLINDQPALTITTQVSKSPANWTFAGSDSTRIVFEFKTKDGAGDAHGMMYLRVPRSRLQPGKALKLKLVGRNQQSNDWFMTFRYSFKEKVDVMAMPFLLRDKEARQPLQITVLHFGGPEVFRLKIDGRDYPERRVQNGFNVFEVSVPAVTMKSMLHIEASTGNVLNTQMQVPIRPVIHREIDLVHHAHTDIGYSHIQEDVLKIHVQNIYDALGLIEKTKNYPPESRFKWNIESAWAVENFLHTANADSKAHFFEALRRGQIALAGMYANDLTGLMIPEEMHWLVEYATRLGKQEKFPVNTIMMTDIPGMSWGMVEVMAKNGIRYFSNGPNYVEGLPDKGDRIGHTLFAQGNNAYWWKSPSGKDSMMIWTCGRGYSSWHGFAPGAVHERGAEKIADYMNELDSLKYPYDIVHWRYNIVADNGPTDSTIADFVKEWNEKYVSPQLVLANVNDMFQRFEKKYGKKIPVLSGDFTPYWEDGAYSTAREEGETRVLSEKLAQLIRLADQQKIVIPADLLYAAKKFVVLFHEHTWGAFNSVSRPDDSFVTHQWNYKLRFLDSARYYVDQVNSLVVRAPKQRNQIRVANSLDWARSGWVEWKAAAGEDFNVAVDPAGRKYKVQKTKEGNWLFHSGAVPARGSIQYQLQKSGVSAPFRSLTEFELDEKAGVIRQLQALGMIWVDAEKFQGIPSTLYVKGLDPKNLFIGKMISQKVIEDGPVRKTTRVTLQLEGCENLTYDISQFNESAELKISVIINKKPVREKESVHIAFPFRIAEPTVRVGVNESFIGPGFRQTIGSNTDFYSVQRWIDVSGKNNGVTIVSPQAALYEVGSLINEDRSANGYKIWRKDAPQSATIFAYVMNNYWHTNYKADQEGPVRFDFFLRLHASGFNQKEAYQYGYEKKQPLLVIE